MSSFHLEKKISTYVCPKTNINLADTACSQLPIIFRPLNKVEDLFPLLSDPNYYTDFVVISIEMFDKRADGLDMFDIINTLSTLIKSTVCRRTPALKPQKRDTKIVVVVHKDTDPMLVKHVMNFPAIASVGWLLKNPEDLRLSLEHAERLCKGDFSHDDRVLDLIKPKKNKVPAKNKIDLTVRQSQILQIIQDRGCSNKHIAKILGLSESTVKLHMSQIFKKYGVKNRTQLAVFSKE